MDWVTYGKTRERQKYEQCDVLLKLGVTASKDRWFGGMRETKSLCLYRELENTPEEDRCIRGAAG
jgi:hypothetical protein